MTQLIDDEYLEIIAVAIVNWVRVELMESAKREKTEDGDIVFDGIDFIKMMITRVPAIGGLCLQAGANKHIPFIPMEDHASEADKV